MTNKRAWQLVRQVERELPGWSRDDSRYAWAVYRQRIARGDTLSLAACALVDLLDAEVANANEVDLAFLLLRACRALAREVGR